jgi:hypothetical protein
MAHRTVGRRGRKVTVCHDMWGKAKKQGGGAEAEQWSGGRRRLEIRVESFFAEAAKPMEALQSSSSVQAPNRNKPAQLQHRKRAAAEQVTSTCLHQ